MILQDALNMVARLARLIIPARFVPLMEADLRIQRLLVAVRHVLPANIGTFRLMAALVIVKLRKLLLLIPPIRQLLVLKQEERGMVQLACFQHLAQAANIGMAQVVSRRQVVIL